MKTNKIKFFEAVFPLYPFKETKICNTQGKSRNIGASECYKNKDTNKDMCVIDFYFSVACNHNHTTFSL